MPAALVAVTVNVTGAPSVSPGTIAQWLGSSAVIVCPVDAVTVYEVTGAPSTVAGACQRTVAEAEPGTAVTDEGVVLDVGAEPDALRHRRRERRARRAQQHDDQPKEPSHVWPPTAVSP